jgi:iron complex outermembrane recepter protein
MMRFAVWACLTVLFAATPAQSRTAEAVQTVEFNIKSEALDLALMDWCSESGLRITIDPASGADKIMSPGLQGRYPPEDALSQLLAFTGLEAKRFPGGAYVVRRAHTMPVQAGPPVVSPASPKDLDQVLVTGSHIRGVSPDFSPITVYSLEDMKRTGAITVAQFVRTMPQNFSLLNDQTSVGAGVVPQAGSNVARGSAIDLLGVGPEATLVLLNGQRLAPSGFDASFVDVTMVPFKALQRVEVLADGASAIYGSDAVAGVVNFVLRRDFEGVEVAPYYAVVSDGGGAEHGVSLLAGHRWSSGGFMADYENNQQQAVNASSRTTLVPQSTAFQVVPSQARQSALFTMHQDLAPGTELSGDAFWSERDFDQSYPSDPLVSTQTEGRVKTLGGSFTVGHELPGLWKTDFVGAFAEEEETVTTAASSVSQLFETRSTVTSLDWRANGPVFSTPGGPIRLSLGTSWRWETFNDLVARLGPTGTGLKRTVLGAYGEAFVPLVGPDNAMRWAKRVELSLAVRHDDYRNGDAYAANAASDNPKLGVLWSPFSGISLRGTYAKSFRVAPLAQMNAAKDTAILLPVPNPNAPGTSINTLSLLGGNSALRPEVAQSFTAGVDLKSKALPGWSLSATYFQIHYHDRIAAPPVVGPVSSIYSQLGTLRPYINSAPTPAETQALYNQYPVYAPTMLAQSAVQAIFDSRLQNIASIQASGVELVAKSDFHTDWGDLNVLLQGQYLAQLTNQAAPSTPYVSLVGTVFNPPTVRMQSTLGWSDRGWAASATLDYTSPFKDTLALDAPNVASWLILNTQLSYTTGARFASTPLENTTVSLSVNNLTNRPAPYVQGLAGQTLGYDPSNASPLGRRFLLEITKHW